MGELARAADALLRPELAYGLIAAAVAVVAGRWWWPTVAAPVAVVVGLAWVAAVAAPVDDQVDGPAVAALALVAVVAVLPAGAAPGRVVPAAGVVGVIAALGVFAVVPDTERALALVGGVAVSAAAVRRLDRRWLATVAVAAAWVAVVDGAPRGSAVAGALGCAALPALLAAWPGPLSPGRRRWALVALALAGTAVCSRVAGLRSSTPEAVAIVAVVVDAELAGLVTSRRRRPGSPRTYADLHAEHERPDRPRHP